MFRVGLRPDVIITDNVMPGQVQGLDLARIARELSPDISGLIISGYPDDVHSRIGGSEREIKVLSKPFRKSALLEAIRLVAQKQD